MTIRIWQQSLTDLSTLPGYAAMLDAHARRVCMPGTVVHLHGLHPGTYPPGVAPIELSRLAWPHELATLQIVENVVAAERQGYDAVAMNCFGDPQLDVARSLVDIPVVSAFHTALQVGATMGTSLGLLTLDAAAARRARSRVVHYGYQDRVAAILPLDPPITEHELDDAFHGSPAFVQKFALQAQGLLRAGADVIIPAEGVLNTVLVRNEVAAVEGAPVVDVYGALLAHAEMLIRLRRTAGWRVGRRGAYARPADDVVAHLREATIGALQRAQDATPPPGR